MKLFTQDYAQRKNFVDGTHRMRSPGETVAAYLPFCPSFGITRLAGVTGLDYVGIPVYQCIRPNSRTLSLSQGKGLTVDAAKASALMESIESWHAETMAVPTRYESARLLATRESVIDVERLARNTRRPFSEEEVMPWVGAYDIAKSTTVWLPYELVDLNRVYGARYSQIFQSSSNGLASGNHLLEAVSHALCEVVERDAHTLWHCDESDPLGVSGLIDIDTIDDPACLSVLERFHAADFTVGVHDITSDVGVPCYQTIAIERPESFRPLGYSWGQGCHPAKEVALLRALTEAAQARLTQIAGARDDLAYDEYASVQDAEQAAGLVHTLETARNKLDFRERSSLSTPTFEGDLAAIRQQLDAVGCDSIAVVDLTHTDFNIPVVKVVVPGLEGVLGDPRHFVPGPRARRMLEKRVSE